MYSYTRYNLIINGKQELKNRCSDLKKSSLFLSKWTEWLCEMVILVI
jgi:hypothetical protein